MTTMPEQPALDALTEKNQRLLARTDANTFHLQQQFMRAHGAPRGEVTTLVKTLVEGGVFLSSIDRPQ